MQICFTAVRSREQSRSIWHSRRLWSYSGLYFWCCQGAYVYRWEQKNRFRRGIHLPAPERIRVSPRALRRRADDGRSCRIRRLGDFAKWLRTGASSLGQSLHISRSIRQAV